jgi:hypothetical protein
MSNSYDKQVEQQMVNFYQGLLELDRRRYAAVEASKLGWGGQSYISSLFGLSRQVIRRGQAELDNPNLVAHLAGGRQRRAGGGRKKKNVQ